METSPLLFSIFIITFSLTHYTHTVLSTDDCRPSSCSPTGPQIRFPFRLTNHQPIHCGYPGFSLSCNTNNQTLLTLPTSNQIIRVTRINYVAQIIYIEPQFCTTPGRIPTFNLTGTPFTFTIVGSFTFFNCSATQNIGDMYPAISFRCVSDDNYTMIAIRSEHSSQVEMPVNCRSIATVSLPMRRYRNIGGEMELMWFTPFCGACEFEGKSCRLQGDDNGIGCYGSSRGLPRSAKYGIGIGIGIPGLVCIIGLLCYMGNKVRDYSQRNLQSIDLFSIAIAPQPTSLTGLDEPTIESYPKTVLGESCRLPKLNDGTCSICLSDYQPKEELRTIPECNHYFHAECIDEWLKLNATCPVCRNSPESSSLVTPCSSMSSNSSNSS